MLAVVVFALPLALLWWAIYAEQLLKGQLTIRSILTLTVILAIVVRFAMFIFSLPGIYNPFS